MSGKKNGGTCVRRPFSLLSLFSLVLDLPVFQTSVDYYATAVEDYLAQLVEILGGSTEAYADVLPQVVHCLRWAIELLQPAQPSPLPPPSGSATLVASSPDHTGEDHSDPSPAGSVEEAVAGKPATLPPQPAALPPAVVARQRRRRRIAGGDAGAEAGPSTRRPRSGRVCAVCVCVCLHVCACSCVHCRLWALAALAAVNPLPNLHTPVATFGTTPRANGGRYR